VRYLGGKARIIGKFVHLINAAVAGRALWEPFCGGLNASSALTPARHVLTDVDPYLVTLLRAVVEDGWLPDLNAVDADLYRQYRTNPDVADPLTAFLGYGCSFGGKWFAGYVGFSYDVHHLARGKASAAVKCHPLSAVKALLQARFTLADRAVEFGVRDFLDGSCPEGIDVIYADPPYRGVTGYAGQGAFDSDAFWDVLRAHSAAGVTVFASEIEAPPDFEVIWRGGKGRFLRSDSSNRLEEILVTRRGPRRKRLAREAPSEGGLNE
jgi:DNA adenine methylase